MRTVYIGIDNGATGSIGIVSANYSNFFPTPVKSVPNYTKEVQMISRIDLPAIKAKLLEIQLEVAPDRLLADVTFRALIERPFMSPVETVTTNTGKKVPTVNMMFFKASLNAHRSFEATIILMESMKIGYEVVDSKAWQKSMLGTGISGSKALKEASKIKGIQLYPQHEVTILKHKDADGLLIAAFAQKFYNQWG